VHGTPQACMQSYGCVYVCLCLCTHTYRHMHTRLARGYLGQIPSGGTCLPRVRRTQPCTVPVYRWSFPPPVPLLNFAALRAGTAKERLKDLKIRRAEEQQMQAEPVQG
jgi:hypothetical protein